MRVYKTVVLGCFFVVSALLIGRAMFAQNGSPTALRGVVTDPSGARIPGATIHLRGSAGEQSQTSDANGQYVFSTLSPGKYDVEISAPDFKVDQHQGFNISGATTLDAQLTLEAQAQVLTVQEEATTVSLDP